MHDELFAAGVEKRSRASARLRRAGGRRTFSSSLSRRFARCAEADGRPDSFESSFVCVDPVMTRVQRVTAALHGHHIACGTHPSQISYSVHDACGVHGETKSLSTCTRTGVRRSAVEKLASPQQASLKLHEETWAGLLQNQA